MILNKYITFRGLFSGRLAAFFVCAWFIKNNLVIRFDQHIDYLT